MTRVLKITDGTDTVDFQDASSGYRLLAHTPAVASRRSNNPELYSREVETLEVSVSGDTRAQIAARVQLLTELIDRAQRLRNGDRTVDPVLYQYQVEGSSLASPLQALITGPPPGQRPVVLPARFDGYIADKVGSVDDPILWRFQRRGALLGAAEQETVAAATGNNPGVMSATFASSVAIPAPIKLVIDTSSSGATPGGVVLVGRSTSHLKLVEGESGSGPEYSTVADADASGGNVIRRTPTTTAAQYLTNFGALGVDTGVRRMACVIAVRNLSSTISYKVRFTLNNLLTFSTPVTIGTDTQDPQLVNLGIADSGHRSVSAAFQIETTPDGTGAGGTHGLEIDCIGLVAVDDDAGRVLSFPFLAQSAEDPIIDHALLQAISPIVKDAPGRGKAYAGNPYLYGLSDTMAALVMGVTPTVIAGPTWRIRNADGSLESVGMTVDRRIAHLVPE